VPAVKHHFFELVVFVVVLLGLGRVLRRETHFLLNGFFEIGGFEIVLVGEVDLVGVLHGVGMGLGGLSICLIVLAVLGLLRLHAVVLVLVLVLLIVLV